MAQIHKIACGTVNCFLVSQGKKAILVDTASAGYADKIFKYCRDFEVSLILLTHGHIDHVQNTAVLRERLQAPGGHSCC